MLIVSMISLESWSQIVFNKTEFDFGSISKSASQFEQDFIFRNTGEQDAKILSVRSVQTSLKFIYTRSEVLPSEYGFVKVNIYPDSLEGLFHDEVYITFQYGKEIQSEVLYVRAQIDPNGKQSDQRAFEDGAISTSVEVSTSDIETMEGFMGGDRLSQAESEIAYLKKQVQMKADLIAKLSDDLFQKQAKEQENFKRLAALETTLQENNEKGNQEALAQLQELTSRLVDMRTSDSLLREEITDQEAEYARLKAQADSARNYAENLSAQLQERFESEAKAMERAQRLEKDLRNKELTEKEQQARIDSLTRVLALAEDDTEVMAEINRLEDELEIKRKEQEVNRDNAARQKARIEALRQENELYKMSADSLAKNVASSEQENEALQNKLEASNQRIGSYEAMIDSLQRQASQINYSESESLAELERLKEELNDVEQQDRQLKRDIASKEQELETLQSERDEAKKNMQALEKTTTKQQEHAQNLLHRINSLSTKESQAQLEIKSLRMALKESQYKEDSTRQSVNELVAQIGESEASIKSLADSLSLKEARLGKMQREQKATQDALAQARKDKNADQALIDSLTTALNSKSDGTSMLENDIIVLQKQVLASKNKLEDYKDRATELEGLLANARLSNDLTFQELKGDVDAMRNERDDYKERFKDSQKEIERLESELLESKRNEENAVAFANELSQGSKTKPAKRSTSSNVFYSVHVHTSDQPVNLAKQFPNEQVREYLELGKYSYAIGEFDSLKDAISNKETLKQQGYSKAFIVAFKDGQRISLKEAMETAQR